jgi:hypothetical protein
VPSRRKAIVASRRILDAEGTMRTLAAGGAIVVLSLAVSACAGTGGSNGLTRGSAMDDDIDVGKVVTVNDWAVRRHASVVWVNYPKKSKYLKDTSG